VRRDSDGEITSGDAARDRTRGAHRVGDKAAEPVRQPEQGADDHGSDEQSAHPDRDLGCSGGSERHARRFTIEHPPLSLIRRH